MWQLTDVEKGLIERKYQRVELATFEENNAPIVRVTSFSGACPAKEDLLKLTNAVKDAEKDQSRVDKAYKAMATAFGTAFSPSSFLHLDSIAFFCAEKALDAQPLSDLNFGEKEAPVLLLYKFFGGSSALVDIRLIPFELHMRAEGSVLLSDSAGLEHLVFDTSAQASTIKTSRALVNSAARIGYEKGLTTKAEKENLHAESICGNALQCSDDIAVSVSSKLFHNCKRSGAKLCAFVHCATFPSLPPTPSRGENLNFFLFNCRYPPPLELL